MQHSELMKAINIIREKSEKDKLIVFVGAGVSCNVERMPSWNELVKIMAEEVGYSKCEQCKRRTKICKKSCLLKDSFSTDEFLKIPQYLYNSNKKKYVEKFKEIFKDIDADADLSKAIFELNPAHIITTNYDHLLESPTCELRHQYQVIIEDKDLLDTHASKYIIKMHGDLNNMKSIVLKEQDYLDFSQNKVLIELFVKALLTDHLILFLGYSLNDYNIKLILSWLNFMRQQNGALEGKTVGYIALDSTRLSKIQKKYFEQNSINVLNLYDMPLIENIPTSLTLAEGKRLYSFLRVIQYPRLMKVFNEREFIKDIVKKIGEKPFIPYKCLLKMLQINFIRKIDNTLDVYSENDFTRIKEICENESSETQLIKQHLINNGIYFISFWDHTKINKPTECYTLANHESSNLFKNKLFMCYIENNYITIHNRINDKDKDLEYYFYSHFFCFYNQAIADSYKELDFDALSDYEKLGFLYNKNLLEYWTSFQYNLKSLRDYFEAIPSQEQKNLLSMYKEALDGFQDRRNIINDKLNVLNEFYSGQKVSLGGNTLEPFFEIKNVAIELYKFHFYNRLFCEYRGDFKKVLKLYIEAMICINGEYDESTTDFLGVRFERKKYKLDFLDWDIVTKYISTKELLSILKKYHVKCIAVNIDNAYIISAFKNLITAIDIATRSPYLSFWATITNYMTLMSYIEFNDDEKREIEQLIEKLLSNRKFLEYFFSVNYPECQYSLGALMNICRTVIQCDRLDVIHGILTVPTFFDYFINAGQQSVRALFETLYLHSDDGRIQKTLFDIINAEEKVGRRIKLIWLFKKSIKDQEYIDKFKEMLEDNWKILEPNMFIEFVFSDWLKLNYEKANCIIQEAIDLDKQRSDGVVRRFPDPFDSKIDELCLLIICDKITDIEPLYQIKNKTPQLEFLLSPETFDYSQVDFANYMWENIIRKTRYLPYFIKAKDNMIPKIKKRIEANVASEFEKRVLYGIFMDQNELLNPID